MSAGLRLKPDFLTLVEQQYGVRPKALMGGTKDMADVNDWVAQQTGRKVQRLLTKPFARNPNPVVNTVSAAYFKGWSILQKFEKIVLIGMIFFASYCLR